MKTLLASFDPVPAAKGASAHILRNHQILTEAGHDVSLVTVGEHPLPGLRHRVLEPRGDNWLARAVDFGQACRPLMHQGGFDRIHVRSPFEGLAAPRDVPVVYEVNALYSIELPCRFPALVAMEGFRSRMRAAELLLLERAAAVITPSEVTALYLADLGVQDVRVVPNAPSIPRAERTFEPSTPPHLVYIGTLTAWQGVHQVVRCLARLTHLPWKLSVLSHTRKDRWLRKLLEKLELTDRVEILEPLPPDELGAFLHTCDIGLAPLMPGERNLIQGCMPVKLLDYQRAGLTIVAPDLQVVRHVLGPEAPLYNPWSRTQMTTAIEAALAAPRETRGRAAQQRVEAHFAEHVQAAALLETYATL